MHRHGERAPHPHPHSHHRRERPAFLDRLVLGAAVALAAMALYLAGGRLLRRGASYPAPLSPPQAGALPDAAPPLETRSGPRAEETVGGIPPVALARTGRLTRRINVPVPGRDDRSRRGR